MWDFIKSFGKIEENGTNFVFCYPVPSSSHALSLLVGSRKIILTEIHVESEK